MLRLFQAKPDPIDIEGISRYFHPDFNTTMLRSSAYDAIYLDLEIRRRLPLATLDDDLRRTAKILGVGLLGA